jgi:hypothetical protein
MNHKMEFEIGEDGGLAEGSFLIEPYSRGGRDEPPSGGYALLEEVRVAGFRVPEDDWGKMGLDAERIEELQDAAYADYGDHMRGLEDAAIDAKIDEARERRM